MVMQTWATAWEMKRMTHHLPMQILGEGCAEMMEMLEDDKVILRKVKLVTGHKARKDRNAGGSTEGPG